VHTNGSCRYRTGYLYRKKDVEIGLLDSSILMGTAVHHRMVVCRSNDWPDISREQNEFGNEWIPRKDLYTCQLCYSHLPV
jgi:hypothetical protein